MPSCAHTLLVSWERKMLPLSETSMRVNTVPANRSIEDSDKGFGILAHRES